MMMNIIVMKWDKKLIFLNKNFFAMSLMKSNEISINFDR